MNLSRVMSTFENETCSLNQATDAIIPDEQTCDKQPETKPSSEVFQQNQNKLNTEVRLSCVQNTTKPIELPKYAEYEPQMNSRSYNQNNNNCHLNESLFKDENMERMKSIVAAPLQYITLVDNLILQKNRGKNNELGDRRKDCEESESVGHKFLVHSFADSDKIFPKNEEFFRKHKSQMLCLDEEKTSDTFTFRNPPVRLCVACRMIFNSVEAFISHIQDEHKVTMNERERDLLKCNNINVILQNSEKSDYQLYFLELETEEDDSIKLSKSNSFPEPKGSSKDVELSSEVVYSKTTVKDRKQEQPFVENGKDYLSLKQGLPISPSAEEEHTLVDKLISATSSEDNCSSNLNASQHLLTVTSVQDSSLQFSSQASVENDKDPQALDLSVSTAKPGAALSHSPTYKTEASESSSTSLKMSFVVASPISGHTTSPTQHPMMLKKVMHADSALDPESNDAEIEIQDSGKYSPQRKSPASMPVSMHVETTISGTTSMEKVGYKSSSPKEVLPPSPVAVHQLETNQQNSVESLMSVPSNLDPMFPMSLFQSRNSCKTLKCPKCNWHYKYRQTLEAHMKEKHSEEASDCVYCNAGQPHPRLSRGESYSCGYKPFKCNVCNYSTTTKGNLSIHMQSDKHLYNARTMQQRRQERMRQGVVTTSTYHVPRQPETGGSTEDESSSLKRSPNSSPGSNQFLHFNETTVDKNYQSRRRKSSNRTSNSSESGIYSGTSKTASPTLARRESSSNGKWRCDVCCYETSIARNLRIHMTSEKHAQNSALKNRGLLAPKQDEESKRERDDCGKASEGTPSFAGGAQGLMEYYAAALKSLQADGQSDTPGRSFSLAEDAEKTRKAQTQYLQHQLFLAQQQQLLLAQQYQQFMMAAAAASSLQQRLSSPATKAGGNLLQSKNHEQLTMHQPQDQLFKHFFPYANNDLPLVPPMSAPDQTLTSNVSPTVFSCGLCGIYGTDNISALEDHVRKPRYCEASNDLINNEWVTRTRGSDREGYFCRLCSYSTPLKTNFNLHCKTEKHTCKLNLIAHIREGGAATEWMIPHIIRGNMAQSVSCNACRFVTHSFEKLKLHCSTDQHRGVFTVYQYLETMLASRLSEDKESGKTAKENYRLKCKVCNDYSTKYEVDMVKHMQTSEHQLQLQSNKNLPMTTLQDVISVEREAEKVQENNEGESSKAQTNEGSDQQISGRCQFCNYESDNKDRMELHILTQHSNQPPTSCPLCQEVLKSPLQLRLHLVNFHNLQIPPPEQIAPHASPTAVVQDNSQDTLPSKGNAPSESTKTNDDQVMEDDRCVSNGVGMNLDQPKDIDEASGKNITTDTHHPCASPSSENLSSSKSFIPEDSNHSSKEEAVKNHSHQSNSLIMQVLREQTVASSVNESPVHQKITESSCEMNADISNSASTNVEVMQDLKISTDLNSVFSEPERMNAVSRSCPNLAAVVSESADQSRISRPTTFLRRQGHPERKMKRIRVRSCPLDEGSSSRTYRHLLSNYGLEQAKHYVENRSPQNRTRAKSFKLEKYERKWASLTSDDERFNDDVTGGDPESSSNTEGKSKYDGIKDGDDAESRLSNREVEVDEEAETKACPHCGKEFSGVWVLKAHEEMAHGVCVSANNIQDLAAVYSDQLWDRIRKAKENEMAQRGVTDLTENKSMHNQQKSADNNQGNLQVPDNLSGNKGEANLLLLQQQHQQQMQQHALLKLLLNTKQTKQMNPIESNFSIGHQLENLNPALFMSEPNTLSANIASQMGMYSALFQAQAQTLGITPYQLLANAAVLQQIQQMNLAGPANIGGADENANRSSSVSFPTPTFTVNSSTIAGSQSRPNFDAISKQEQTKQITSGSQLAQEHLQAQANALEIPSKRPRTRITDDQLKILRANFDINNSPSEEQIDEMANRTGLPPKVIKHWFRNTLFKERQRSKDSPYNFNIPPTMSLEDAYKNETEDQDSYKNNSVSMQQSTSHQDASVIDDVSSATTESHFVEDRSEPSAVKDGKVGTEIDTSLKTSGMNQEPSDLSKSWTDVQKKEELNENVLKNFTQTSGIAKNLQQALFTNALALVPNLSPKPNINQKPRQDSDVTVQNNANEVAHAQSILPQLPIPKHIFNPMSGWPALTSYETNLASDSLYYEMANNSDGSSLPHLQGGACRRTPRTRFTDFQLQILQEFFDRNAYPKDDDLDKLSQTLNLSTRVIVVWFQNARQKARKSYEQQQHINSGRLSPAVDHGRSSANKLGELLINQKLLSHSNSSGVEDLARKALSEVSKNISQNEANQSFPSIVANHARNRTEFDIQTSTDTAIPDISESKKPVKTEASISCQQCDKVFTTPEEWQSHQQEHLHANMASMIGQYGINGLMYMQSLMGQHIQQYGGEQSGPVKKNESSEKSLPLKSTGENRSERNVPTDQRSHWSKQNLVTNGESNLLAAFQEGRLFDKSMSSVIRTRLVTPPISGSIKRKISTSPTLSLSSSSSSSASPIMSHNGGIRNKAPYMDEKEGMGMQKDPKRLRTTITPEQLEYLYQQYLVDSSPSRKIIEQISEVVGLKKRVVQVWFQNTRARERKGQFRSSIARCVTGSMSQYKVCHLCKMVFRSKPELDAHVQSTHSHPEVESRSYANDGPSEKKARLSSPQSSNHLSSATAITNKDNTLYFKSENQVKSESYKENTVNKVSNESLFPSIKTEFLTSNAAGSSCSSTEDSRSSFSIAKPFDYAGIFASNPSQTASLELQKKLAALYASSLKVNDPNASSHNQVNSSNPGKMLHRSSPEEREEIDSSSPALHSTSPEKTTFGASSSSFSPATHSTTLQSLSSTSSDVTMNKSSIQVTLPPSTIPISQQPTARSVDYSSSLLKQQPLALSVSSQANQSDLTTPTKRYRTPMTSSQVAALKYCFKVYKTPSLAECEILGNEVGLQKRVIQVWFQNARAKDKKRRLQQVGSDLGKFAHHEEGDMSKECDICIPVVHYTSPKQARDHVFSQSHLHRLMKVMESEKFSEFSPGLNVSQGSPCSSYDSMENQLQGDNSGFESPTEHRSPDSVNRHQHWESTMSEKDAISTRQLAMNTIAASMQHARLNSSAKELNNSNAESEQMNDNEEKEQGYSRLVANDPVLLQQYQKAMQQLITGQPQNASTGDNEIAEAQQNAILQQALQKSLYQILKLPQASPTGSQ